MKILLISFLFFVHITNNQELIQNTEWISKTSAKHSDTFSFLENSFLIHRCVSRQQIYHGSYIFSKDTLIIKEREQQINQKPAYYRIKFLLKGDALYPYSHEELINHQWTRSKKQMRKSYIFKKTNLPAQV